MSTTKQFPITHTKVFYEMDVNEYGETKTISDFLLYADEFTIDKDEWMELFDEWVHLTESEKPNNDFVKKANEYRGCIIDFRVTEILHFREEKSFRLIIPMPFFSNRSLEEEILHQFTSKFPKISIGLMENIDTERMDDGLNFITTFTSCEDIEHYYTDDVKEGNAYKRKSMDFDKNIENEFPYVNNGVLTNISELNGKTVILEGDLHIGDHQKKIVKILDEQNKHVRVITDLYLEPTKLAKITDCDNLIIQTTGLNSELSGLVDTFKKLKYLPKRVIFLLETIHLPDFPVELYKSTLSHFDLTLISSK